MTVQESSNQSAEQAAAALRLPFVAIYHDAADPSFLQARKRHVIDLVLSGTLGRSQSRLPS